MSLHKRHDELCFSEDAADAGLELGLGLDADLTLTSFNTRVSTEIRLASFSAGHCAVHVNNKTTITTECLTFAFFHCK